MNCVGILLTSVTYMFALLFINEEASVKPRLVLYSITCGYPGPFLVVPFGRYSDSSLPTEVVRLTL
jgi:hypothetical protein